MENPQLIKLKKGVWKEIGADSKYFFVKETIFSKNVYLVGTSQKLIDGQLPDNYEEIGDGIMRASIVGLQYYVMSDKDCEITVEHLA